MKQRLSVTNFILAVSLTVLFSVSALLLVTLGAGVYQGSVENAQKNEETRTPILFLAEKLRQGDHQNGIRIGSVADSDALILCTEESGDSYETYLYVFEGTLYEVLVHAGTEVLPEYGQPVMELSALVLSEDRFGRISVTAKSADGNEMNYVYTPRCR